MNLHNAFVFEGVVPEVRLTLCKLPCALVFLVRCDASIRNVPQHAAPTKTPNSCAAWLAGKLGGDDDAIACAGGRGQGEGAIMDSGGVATGGAGGAGAKAERRGDAAGEKRQEPVARQAAHRGLQ